MQKYVYFSKFSIFPFKIIFVFGKSIVVSDRNQQWSSTRICASKSSLLINIFINCVVRQTSMSQQCFSVSTEKKLDSSLLKTN